ncbi:MAG: hypothetical protein GC168_18190 [Candidatus Hydrogenedens sp.]|nr:hypothetical protein [Candidatus Hydrogenedens sp.]
MPFIDREGRLLGRLNLIDAALLLGALLAGAAAYHVLTAGNRVAPPFALPENTAWVDATLWLPPEQAFLLPHLKTGSAQRDPRTGAVLADITGAAADAQGVRVELRLSAQRDSEGRWIYRSRALLVGRELEIETETVALKGLVARFQVSAK